MYLYNFCLRKYVYVVCLVEFCKHFIRCHLEDIHTFLHFSLIVFCAWYFSSVINTWSGSSGCLTQGQGLVHWKAMFKVESGFACDSYRFIWCTANLSCIYTRISFWNAYYLQIIKFSKKNNKKLTSRTRPNLNGTTRKAPAFK